MRLQTITSSGTVGRLQEKHRLHALCPYFAMFPHTFARSHVLAHTFLGQVVFDPFSGRGTTLLESLLLGREAVAADINPVAACVTGAKARVPLLPSIESRLKDIQSEFKETARSELDEERRSLPPFFSHAFEYRTLRELLFLRRQLRWHDDDVDRFIAALTIGSLHGEMDRSSCYFSNQMPRTISTKPDYSVRYWQKHSLRPRRRQVFQILQNRAWFRLQWGAPPRRGLAVRGDVREMSRLLDAYRGRVQAVITSPPYLDVTNFEEDQWLRLWFFGGPPNPTYNRISKDDRYSNAGAYWQFLAEAWRGVAPLLAKDAVLVCRLGGKKQTVDTLARGMVGTVTAAIPTARLVYGPWVSAPLQRQTNSFRPGTKGCGVEVDFVFRT